MAVVISEETGMVSVAEGGRFTMRDLDEWSLHAELVRLLYPGSASEAESSAEAAEPGKRAAGVIPGVGSRH